MSYIVVGVCPGSITDPNFGVLRVEAGLRPNVGTVLQVQCNDGYEQTTGLPVLVCQRDLTWNDAPSNVMCSRASSFTRSASALMLLEI